MEIILIQYFFKMWPGCYPQRERNERSMEAEPEPSATEPLTNLYMNLCKVSSVLISRKMLSSGPLPLKLAAWEVWLSLWTTDFFLSGMKCWTSAPWSLGGGTEKLGIVSSRNDEVKQAIWEATSLTSLLRLTPAPNTYRMPNSLLSWYL